MPVRAKKQARRLYILIMFGIFIMLALVLYCRHHHIKKPESKPNDFQTTSQLFMSAHRNQEEAEEEERGEG